jgi:hypothetical protein
MQYPINIATVIKSSVFSRYPFNNILGTPPRSPNEAGVCYTVPPANTLNLSEIKSLVKTLKVDGWLIPIEQEIDRSYPFARTSLLSSCRNDCDFCQRWFSAPYPARQFRHRIQQQHSYFSGRKQLGADRGGDKDNDKDAKKAKKESKKELIQKTLEQAFGVASKA